MTIRDSAPNGAPCWADLWTSDVEGSRRFYGELFGWEAEAPEPQFGGYFNFRRNGLRVAGCMGDMGDMKATDTWKPYLATDDITKMTEAAEAEGAQFFAKAMPVADLGIQAVFSDPTGAGLGAWQPVTFPGITVFDEPGTPSWFELHTRDHAKAVAFYRDVFGLEAGLVSDTEEFRYAVLRHPSGGPDLAGVMDASSYLADGESPYWTIYWHSADLDATVARAKSLGGSVVHEAENTPYGRLATLADPAGARFRLRQP